MHASHQEMHELDIRLIIRTACKAKRYTSIEGPGFEQYLVFLTTFGPPGCAAARACPMNVFAANTGIRRAAYENLHITVQAIAATT